MSASTLQDPMVSSLPFENLTSDSEVPDRSNVFHVTFPKETTTGSLVKQFSPFGKFRVKWIDDYSACLIFEGAPLGPLGLSLFYGGTKDCLAESQGPYNIVPFTVYQENLNMSR